MMIPGEAGYEILPRSHGTLNWTDVLGIESSPMQLAAPISSGGPNQTIVNPAFTGPGTMVDSGPGPAFSVLGLALLLVAWRVAIELGAE